MMYRWWPSKVEILRPETAERFHKRYLGPRRDEDRDVPAHAVDMGEVWHRDDLDATLAALSWPPRCWVAAHAALTGRVRAAAKTSDGR
ncbi:hypothetical protein QF026_008227 [Streptomyces aurantiacus]|nr:hypothetical protein [Streptomyces aurantiacus]